MFGVTWDVFKRPRWGKRSGPPRWATEDTGQVEQLRQAERRIAATSGWNSSTLVLDQVLRRLRGANR